MLREASAALVENPGFDSQHTNGDSKPSVTPASGILASGGTRYSCGTDIDTGKIYPS